METPGVLVYDYNPMLDELTIEMSLENGEREIIVASEYVQNMEEHGYLTAEHVEKERKNLIDASQHALSGVTEFEGCFSKTQGLQWYRFHYISLADETGKVYRIVGRGENITEEKSNVISWKQKAMKDSLTGLLNYASAKTIINDMLTKRKQGALILLDVDNFKEVNDTLGHLAGDEMLIEIAKTLKNVFKEENIIARFGGDEFLVFIHEDEENAESLLTELLENITHISRNGKIHAKCSAGLVYIQNENESLDELFQQADDALYESKRNGKNTYTIYR